jgi:hypothetical protein
MDPFERGCHPVRKLIVCQVYPFKHCCVRRRALQLCHASRVRRCSPVGHVVDENPQKLATCDDGANQVLVSINLVISSVQEKISSGHEWDDRKLQVFRLRFEVFEREVCGVLRGKAALPDLQQEVTVSDKDCHGFCRRGDVSLDVNVGRPGFETSWTLTLLRLTSAHQAHDQNLSLHGPDVVHVEDWNILARLVLSQFIM